MAQKTQPNSYRLGITLPWSSRWFFKRINRFFLVEDHAIREIIREKISAAGIASIDIERVGDTINVFIKAGRPGLIIGRGGRGIEDLKNLIQKSLQALRQKNKRPLNYRLNLNIEELKRMEISAVVMAQQIASDIEKRMPYRMLLKRQIEQAKQNREIQGVKIRVSGRLNGSEIARNDWLAHGKMPLQTLRARIDYGEATAFNTYGTVGVKVWLYKGQIFDENKK